MKYIRPLVGLVLVSYALWDFSFYDSKGASHQDYALFFLVLALVLDNIFVDIEDW